mmetsp:Transcript_7830/g.15955  ORF Transcript_7830/g.15955 Transcript_7830/m.15955 type:complete len:111 (-) Transcript_7830:33-365(-)
MLRNWCSDMCGLGRVRATGGVVLQLLVPPGPSDYQIAEADMARKEGVEVVVVDCTDIKNEASEHTFEEMPEVRAVNARQAKTELTALLSRLTGGTPADVRPSASSSSSQP